MAISGSSNGTLLNSDRRNGRSGPVAKAAVKWLWRRGDIQLWQDYGRDRSGLGRTDLRYFVGTPGSATASFDVLHDACIHFCRVTHGR